MKGKNLLKVVWPLLLCLIILPSNNAIGQKRVELKHIQKAEQKKDIPKLLEFLDRGKYGIYNSDKGEAIKALGRLHASDALPKLIEILNEELVRVKRMGTLADNKSDFQLFITTFNTVLLLNDSDAVASDLSKANYESAAFALTELLGNSYDPDHRRANLTILESCFDLIQKLPYELQISPLLLLTTQVTNLGPSQDRKKADLAIYRKKAFEQFSDLMKKEEKVREKAVAEALDILQKVNFKAKYNDNKWGIHKTYIELINYLDAEQINSFLREKPSLPWNLFDFSWKSLASRELNEQEYENMAKVMNEKIAYIQTPDSEKYRQRWATLDSCVNLIRLLPNQYEPSLLMNIRREQSVQQLYKIASSDSKVLKELMIMALEDEAYMAFDVVSKVANSSGHPFHQQVKNILPAVQSHTPIYVDVRYAPGILSIVQEGNKQYIIEEQQIPVFKKQIEEALASEGFTINPETKAGFTVKFKYSEYINNYSGQSYKSYSYDFIFQPNDGQAWESEGTQQSLEPLNPKEIGEKITTDLKVYLVIRELVANKSNL